MDYREVLIISKRPKKKDKSREKLAHNGHYSAKHIRISEHLKEKKS